jgi:hypothetical protein
MNERIRQLVRESHLDVYGLGLDKAKWEHTIEKFAELIVQECMEVVSKKCASPTAYNALVEHFGVEE